MKKISAVIIAKNEEVNLTRCLGSIKWVDEIIVIDSGSTDSTRAIAESARARVFNIDWEGFGPAKQFGVEKASGDWILSLDADEEIPVLLKDEILSVLSSNSNHAGYYMPRLTLFLGRWIRHSGWYPDYVLRLFDRRRGSFDGAVVHEKVVIDGKAGHLKNHILHYSYPTLEFYLRKFNRYTTLGAEEAFAQGKKAGISDLIVRPPMAFFKHYISKQGFRDGFEGFMVSFLSSVSVMVKYAKLRDLYRREKEGSDK
ncbi:Uncharacterized glycosyltransferase HI_0653 [Candidatus Zixiibacteriota bacterium]|nr:Uncharacterized glycosyltransferase HI_0653 [candidate division Zixibacteria bacterium]